MTKSTSAIEQVIALFSQSTRDDAVVGEHLTNPEFVAYDMELLEPDELIRIEAHLESCAECSERMDWLLAASEAWNSKEGRERIQRAQARLLGSQPDFWTYLQQRLDAAYAEMDQLRSRGVSQGRQFLQAQFPSSTPNLWLSSYAAEARDTWQTGELVDGILTWSVERLPNGDLDIEVSSFVLPEGTKIRFNAGDWHTTEFLRRVAVDQVGVQILVDAETRRRLPEDSPLRIYPLVEDSSDT